MSALALRFGPKVAKSALLHQSRHHMASSAAAADPIQRLFVDKIREFRASNKGLDEAHQKLQADEMARLVRVYRIENESKLAHVDAKFPSEVNVSLRDIDESSELRKKIESGDYQAQLSAEASIKSPLLESIPDQTQLDMHLPPMNKPNYFVLQDSLGKAQPFQIGDMKPDYEFVGPNMTPEKLEEKLLVKFGPNMPTIDDDKSPQRDVVNFPRQDQLETSPPTRFHIVPESWFQFFYPKTGVTGPYAFAGSFLTFLLSKEWLVYEHELLSGIAMITILSYGVLKVGPKLSASIKKDIKEETDAWEHWRKGNIELLENMQQHYKTQLDKSALIKEIYEVRSQDIDMQLEAEYRNRLKSVYEDTRRRLNYLVAKAESERQIQHKNLVNWVVTQANQSFGQKQENEVLDNCIGQLKALALKNTNVI